MHLPLVMARSRIMPSLRRCARVINLFIPNCSSVQSRINHVHTRVHSRLLFIPAFSCPAQPDTSAISISQKTPVLSPNRTQLSLSSCLHLVSDPAASLVATRVRLVSAVPRTRRGEHALHRKRPVTDVGRGFGRAGPVVVVGIHRVAAVEGARRHHRGGTGLGRGRETRRWRRGSERLGTRRGRGAACADGRRGRGHARWRGVASRPRAAQHRECGGAHPRRRRRGSVIVVRRDGRRGVAWRTGTSRSLHGTSSGAHSRGKRWRSVAVVSFVRIGDRPLGSLTRRRRGRSRGCAWRRGGQSASRSRRMSGRRGWWSRRGRRRWRRGSGRRRMRWPARNDRRRWFRRRR